MSQTMHWRYVFQFNPRYYSETNYGGYRVTPPVSVAPPNHIYRSTWWDVFNHSYIHRYSALKAVIRYEESAYS